MGGGGEVVGGEAPGDGVLGDGVTLGIGGNALDGDGVHGHNISGDPGEQGIIGWFKCIQCGRKHVRSPGAVVTDKCKQCGGGDCCVGLVYGQCGDDYHCGSPAKLCCDRRCSKQQT